MSNKLILPRSPAVPGKDAQNILLAGIPRGGTTAVCWLLNQVDNVVALPEPMDVGKIMDRRGSHAAACEEIANYLRSTREQILSKSEAWAKVVNGVVASNFFADPIPDQQSRIDRSKVEKFKINRPMNEDFVLLLKHPNLFMGMLPGLADRFRVYGIVRHPLAVLASWNTVESPQRKGRAPAAEAFAPGLVKELDACADLIDRQILLLSWMFGRLNLLPAGQVIRYEDLVDAPGATLAAFVSRAKLLEAKLDRFDVASRYSHVPLENFRARLRQKAQSFAPFYTDI
jgi:hypothetical protein